MSCRKPRTQGKGDARRDNLNATIANWPKTGNQTRGTVTLKKGNFTRISYK